VPARRRLKPLVGGTIERAKGASMYGGVDWSRTRAYAQLRSAVRLNLAGREPEGTVSPRDAEAVLDEIASRAGDVCLPDGRQVFTRVCRAEDIYDGDPPIPGGPDLIMVPANGMHVKSRDVSGEPGWLKRQWTSGVYMPSGVHTDIGMAIASGAGVRAMARVGEVDIHQLAPSVLAVMGVDPPPTDGMVFPFISGAQERRPRASAEG
jgi:predicted AlkP superfamily phosphohydrolase/phosphomutase